MSFKNHRNFAIPHWPFEINKDSPQAQGLHAWWPAVHFSPTKLYDMTTRGKYHMAIRGGPVWAGSPNGQMGLFFDGTNGDCYVADSDANPAEFTWVAWHAPIVDSFTRTICMGSVGDAPGSAWSHGLYTAPGGVSIAYTFPLTQATSTTTHSAAYPICTAGRVNSSENAVFVNGVKESTQAGGTPFGGLDGWHLGPPTGFIPFAVPGRYSGWIYDVRLYYRALSDGEIAAIYNHDTRYELYWQPGRRVFSIGSASAVRNDQVIFTG